MRGNAGSPSDGLTVQVLRSTRPIQISSSQARRPAAASCRLHAASRGRATFRLAHGRALDDLDERAALEQCDLGLGPGVVKGAYAQLPKYFADADRVRLGAHLAEGTTVMRGKGRAVVTAAVR